MMDRDVIRAMAELALLEFSEEEERKIEEEMKEIVRFFRIIREAAERGTEDLSGKRGGTILREDEPSRFEGVPLLMKGAPSKEKGLFAVHQVIEKGKKV